MTEFFEEWFGIHGGREVFYADRRSREFIERAEQLEDYVVICKHLGIPAFMSVQPYQARDQPFGLEKLFFEFDCEGDISKAWNDAKGFSESLIRYYDIMPFVKFSGRKGYHVDVFLTRLVVFPTWRLEFVKSVYEKLQRKILKGLKFETLDPNVVGDIKRLERIPYSVHEKSGELCVPVDLEGKPLTIDSLDPYRKRGLETKILETICREIQSEEKFHRVLSNRRKSLPKYSTGIRPCIEKALTLPLHTGAGHKMRLAIACEYLHKGFSTEQVIDLFHSQVDFNEKKTRYFIEDAKKKGYKPSRCKTIERLGFCLKDECPIHKKRKGS